MMSFKFIRVTDFYPQFLSEIQAGNPTLSLKTCNEINEYLTQNSTEISSGHVLGMRKYGVNASEFITNSPFVVSALKKEINKPEASLADLVIAYLKREKAEVIWLDTTSLLTAPFIKRVREEVGALKCIAGHLCAPFNQTIERGLRELDLVITCTPCLVKDLKLAGVKKVELLYHSFNKTILDSVVASDNPYPQTDFVFTGSLYTGFGLHKTRIEYLEEMIKAGVGVTIYGNLESRATVLKKQLLYWSVKCTKAVAGEKAVLKMPVLGKYANYDQDKVSYYSSQLIKATLPPVFGINMFKALSRASICFNIHGEIAKKCGGNIRLFEATGIGTCLVTDWKENMPQLFDCNTEIVTYTSQNECLEKVKWLVNQPEERRKIALAGQQRVFKDHLVENRVEQIISFFKESLK